MSGGEQVTDEHAAERYGAGASRCKCGGLNSVWKLGHKRALARPVLGICPEEAIAGRCEKGRMRTCIAKYSRWKSSSR